MNEYVQLSVNSRLDFFEKYYTVPNDVLSGVEQLKKDIIALGESCNDSTEFETKFVSTGLSDNFNNLLTCCTPKAYQMTSNEKQYAKEVAKEIVVEGGKKQIAKDIINDVADRVAVEVNEDLTAAKRKVMIEAGVFDEYTKVSNAVDDGGRLFGFFKKRFKK